MQHLAKKRPLSQREDEGPVKKVEKRKSSGNPNLELFLKLQQKLLFVKDTKKNLITSWA